jgi:3-oxoacyl-[acyl-carrier protein] reductase
MGQHGSGAAGLLAGRTALVTGAARGIGLAIATRFLDAGAAVLLADRDEGELAAARATLLAADPDRSERVAIGDGDVTDGEAVERLVGQAVERFGGLTTVVNNAGVTRDALLHRMTEEQFDEVLAVSVKGAWLVTKHAATVLRDVDGAAIVNISSISGKVGNIGQTNYAAAKAALIGLTKASAKELARSGVRVNAIQPGLIATQMVAAIREDLLAAKVAEIPLGRVGEPEEVADAALFLASSMSSYTTGAVLEVTGGRHM